MLQHHDEQKIQQAIVRTLEIAKQQGASSAEVSASLSSGFSVTVRMGEIETLEHNRDKHLEITAYQGQQSGIASTGDFSEEALQLTVAKAISIAKFTNEDPYSGIPEKNLIAFQYPDLHLYHPWSITPQQAAELALRCENMARAQDKRIVNSEGATVSSHSSIVGHGNSDGFVGTYKTSRHVLSCMLIASDGHQMHRDHDYSIARDASELWDVEQLARSTAQRTLRRLNARKISTRQCPVIFDAENSRSLLGHFLGAISGNNLYRKSSFLYDHLHQPVFGKHVHFYEEPHLPKAMGSAPFDAEGVITKRKDIIKQGMLETYLLDSYSARKLHMHSTGNAGGIHNLVVETSNMNLSELLRQMDTGLLVAEAIGQGVNIVTGDYSRGAFGFWVEKGEIQFPVEEITMAGNLKDMYKNLVAIANDVDTRGNVCTGSILLENMTIAGE